MTELEDFNNQISKDLDYLEKEIKTLSKKDYSQKQQAFSKIQKFIKSVKTLLESYELEICNLPKNEMQE